MFLGALCLIALSDSKSEPTPKLRTVESKYYIIETDVPPERAKFIGALMDATGMEYDRRFQGFRGEVSKKPRLKVFASQEDYVAALSDGGVNTNVEHTGGVYRRLDVTVYSFDHEGLEHTLKHECFHQFADKVVGGKLCPWVNEGLAEYFAEGVFDQKSGKLRLGAISKSRVHLLKEAAAEKRLISVNDLLRIDLVNWNDNLGTPWASLQYAQAWALCHFLVHADGGKFRPFFDAFLKSVDKGLDCEGAFRQAFGPDTEALQAKYITYIEGLVAGDPILE